MANNVTKIRDSEPEVGGKMPDAMQLAQALSEVGRLKAKVSELSGDIGQYIKTKVETINLHKGAFRLIAKLRDMDETKRSEFLAHFDHYREKIGLDAQADLFEDGGDEARFSSNAAYDDQADDDAA
jgi:uncharacterized protein (UPF0335 family)